MGSHNHIELAKQIAIMNSSEYAVYVGLPAMTIDASNSTLTMSGCEHRDFNTVGGFRGETPLTGDMKEFCLVARILGFLLGLLFMAADVSGQVFLLRAVHPTDFTSVLLFTGFWSMLWSVILFTVLLLICRLLELTLQPHSDEMAKAIETHSMLWVIIGVAFGYTVVDFFFLPAFQWWCTVGVLATVFVMFKLVTTGFPCCFRRGVEVEERTIEREGDQCERLMIV